MPVPSERLFLFLARVRRAAGRRLLLGLVLDLALALAAIGLAALGFAGTTARGDWAQLGSVTAGASVALVLCSHYARRWQLRHGSPLATARTVARGVSSAVGWRADPGPDDSPDDPRPLLSEILGATELVHEGRVNSAHSEQLATLYIAGIGKRCADLPPRRLLAPLEWRRRLWVAAAFMVALVPFAVTDAGRQAADLLWLGRDGTPPRPLPPVWSSLDVRLVYPDHIGRRPRNVPNPSGAMRAPAGTQIELDLRLVRPTDTVKIVVTHDADELTDAIPPEIVPLSPTGGRNWHASFVLRSAGSWTVVLLEHPDDDVGAADHRSRALRLELEPDAPPQIELLPLPADEREPTEAERVDIRFRARDDFGLGLATLVYELPGGKLARLPAGDAQGRRSWRHRYVWDLAGISIAERSEITYWLEIRDNDPGMGLHPLPDSPGKLVTSARQKLFVRDEEAEHTRNIESLRTIRDRTVDLLGTRLVSPAFQRTPAGKRGLDARIVQLRQARGISAFSQRLLTSIRDTIDALSIDRMVRERDVRGLIAVHKRLLELYRKETTIHTSFPPDMEQRRPQDVAWVLARLGRHNRLEVPQLEDDIIRLDDLVDGQIVAGLERLLARLQTSQQKLLELLEKLSAGDASVRPQIDQLEQRIREDLRRLSAARARLRKEVGEEYMNLDAFRAMEARVRHQDIKGSLARGDTGDALRKARETLDQIGALQDAVQDRGANGEDTRLSEEEEARMQLLRELSRLKDEESKIHNDSSALERAWRTAVREADPPSNETHSSQARKLREGLENINDARLSRRARRDHEDAREYLDQLEHIERLEQQNGQDRQDGQDALARYDAVRKAAHAIASAYQGAANGEKEKRALRKLRASAQSLEQKLRRNLPSALESLSVDEKDRSGSVGSQQAMLRERLDGLMQQPGTRILPNPGRVALRSASAAMLRGERALRGLDPEQAAESTTRARAAIQRAIDSLRQGGAPPPTKTRSHDASTEGERDRSLRDALMDAMREDAPSGFDGSVERYYEELLQ
ncbi:MAG: hypothetical protein V3V08_21240 [Nannocystaceae bacterium]